MKFFSKQLLLAISFSMASSRVIPSSCLCTQEFAPVCGVDSQNYSNRCTAGCQGVEVECEGECPCNKQPPCLCTREYFPVCGQDGQEYPNECLARCKGVVPECLGWCPCKQNDCNCGPDEECVEYQVQCIVAPCPVVSTCVKKQTGSCSSCPETRSPVCGVDERTYSNRCEAECQGVEVECEGECICTGQQQYGFL